MCSDCKNLDIKDKIDAKVNGKLYYCKIKKRYCNGCGECANYIKDEKRKKEEINEVAYNLAKSDNTSINEGFAILVIFAVLFVIAKLF